MTVRIRRPYIRAKAAHQSENHSRPSWRHDLVVGLVSGAVVAAASMLGQSALDDDRSSREERRENLRFIRERSSSDKQDRPFGAMDIRDQNLSGLLLVESDFTDSDMSNSNLDNVVLQEAKLVSSNLTGSSLYRANLRSADLAHARLTGADLISASLKSARLEAVEFKNANLSYADLSESDLPGANFEGADLTGAKFENICYDDTTVWPENFTPPPSTESRQCHRLYISEAP